MAYLITGSLFQEIYAETVSFFPGFMYLLTAGLMGISLVIQINTNFYYNEFYTIIAFQILVSILYFAIVKYEERFGVIGSKQ